MSLGLFNDEVDDVPADDVEIGFSELNNTLSPALLPPGTTAKAENVWFDTDAVARTRPGLRQVSDVQSVTGNPLDGIAYYDTPAREALLIASGSDLFEVTSDAPGQTTTLAAAGVHTAGSRKVFDQLVDRMFWSTDTDLRWAQWTGASWATGVVTQFSNNNPLPAFKTLCAHQFRLFGVPVGTDQIFPSKILSANLSGTGGDWVETDGIRVGKGGGDPINAIFSGQNANLIVLNEGSAWRVDTSDLSPANWSIERITDLTGCVAGATAMLVGQDVLFLSRYGVVSLGSLQLKDSISPADTLSAPVQSTIDRINWEAVDSVHGARATMWRHLYLLAVPVDGSEWANRILAYNTLTKKWVGEWTTNNPQFTASPGGWGVACVSRFGGRQETIWADIDGGLYRLDDTYEKDDVPGGAAVDVESMIRTRALTCGAQVNRKQPFWLELEFFKSTSTGLTVIVIPDDEKAYPDTTIAASRVVQAGFSGTNSQGFPLQLPFQFSTKYVRRVPWHIRDQPPFRDMAIAVYSAHGKLNVRGLRLAAFIDSVRLS